MTDLRGRQSRRGLNLESRGQTAPQVLQEIKKVILPLAEIPSGTSERAVWDF